MRLVSLPMAFRSGVLKKPFDGMTLMALFMSAEARGYASSGIGALANYGDVVHATLGLPNDELVVCGIALGVADESELVNQFRTDRDTLESFSSFTGFEN